MYILHVLSASGCLVRIFKLCILSMLMQGTTCQWSLVVQLLEFHNAMNIETIEEDYDEIRYCCCDDQDTCQLKSIFYNNTSECSNECDTFFLLSLNDENSELQSISTINGIINNSPPHSLYGYTFSFALDSIPNLVRHVYTLITNCLQIQ